jgi:hypothetical protein
MAMNTQNMIVLTLEFTNYSFFAAKKKPFPRPSFFPATPPSFRRLNDWQSGRKVQIPAGAHKKKCSLMETVTLIVLPE